MAAFDNAFLDFRRLDRLADGDTAIHRLDPRAKVLVTLVFIGTVISYGKYAVTGMIPLIIFPVAMVSLGDLPPSFIAKKILLLCPFALVVGMLNPIYDREVLLHLGPVGIAGGWLSLTSIILRAVLTVGAGIILVATTGFPAICEALERLGAPAVFAVQLLFLYRYIFVLVDEGGRVARARELRSFGKKGLGISSYGSLVGHLLLRTWNRAERIHRAMLARGFVGEFHTCREFRFGSRELLFLCGWSALFIILRLYNLPLLLGNFVTDSIP